VVAFHPTTTVGDVVVVIRDFKHVATIRGQMQRVDQLAALGAHVASLAHEIAGGLMGIQVLIDALEPRTPGEVTLHEKLREEAERAACLLTEIRSFGQTGARERVHCNLGRLVEEVLWMLERRFMAKGITVERHLNLNLSPVLVDRDRIVQAILNSLTNAFEATPADGRVAATVDRVGGATVIKVANTGSFIASEERERIFTLFYTTKRGGSGFGLAQARRALADHGGEIDVTSSREQGTEFILRFPDQPHANDAHQMDLSREQARAMARPA
jgi:signal transduction histidine kinase